MENSVIQNSDGTFTLEFEAEEYTGTTIYSNSTNNIWCLDGEYLTEDFNLSLDLLSGEYELCRYVSALSHIGVPCNHTHCHTILVTEPGASEDCIDSCPSDIDENGLVGVSDLLELLIDFNSACE